MKLSDNTLTILKNFAGINNSILVKQGTNLRTISVAKNILAEAEIKEEFPREFGIYDLNQFLNGLGLHQDPDLNFGEEILVNGFEFGTIKRIINEIKNSGLINKVLRLIITPIIHIYQKVEKS